MNKKNCPNCGRKSISRNWLILIIVVAVMVALAVLSRILFAFTPGFKPTIAIIIIAGAALGKETGFLTGSLTALISNMFFGQGPWSVYQILLWGLIGYIAGALNKKGLIDNKYFRYFLAFFLIHYFIKIAYCT